MPTDPSDLAKSLIQEHGQARAEEIAAESVFEAQRSGNNFDLSIWREVKRTLRELKAESR
jgi:hypothetical protein